MSEEMKGGTCPCNAHGCGMCGDMHGYKKHMMVKILIIVLLIMAFSLGMEIGELKGEIRSSYGYGGKMMRWDKDANYGYGMMGGYIKDIKTQPPAPTKTQ
jgi:hypothetical protein